MGSLYLKHLSVLDGASAADIFFHAVQTGTTSHYTDAQRTAWAGTAPDPTYWQRRIAGLDGFVAELDGRPVGFMTIDASGLIDLAFVHPDAARQGVGARLFAAVEARAHELGVVFLRVEASEVARPFFERHGFAVTEAQTVVYEGVAMENFKMQKKLS